MGVVIVVLRNIVRDIFSSMVSVWLVLVKVCLAIVIRSIGTIGDTR